MTLCVKRIRELEQIWLRETGKFLLLGPRYGSPHPLFLHERNISKVNIKAMAEMWNATEDELNRFIRLQYHINMEADGTEDAVHPRKVAFELGVPASEAEEFEEYFFGRVRQIHEDREFAENSRPFQDAVHEEWDDDEEGGLEVAHFEKVHRHLAED